MRHSRFLYWCAFHLFSLRMQHVLHWVLTTPYVLLSALNLKEMCMGAGERLP